MNYLIERFVLRKEVWRLRQSYQEKCDLMDVQIKALEKFLAILRKTAERMEELDKTY